MTPLRLPRARTLQGGSVPRIMGIVNVTPDSFSDGGRFRDTRHAVDSALEMLTDGADILDLGGESTRPGGGVYGDGAPELPWQEEWERISPVLTRLRVETDAPISIDTRKAEVARRALEAGADLINDVSCFADPAMAALVAESDVPVVLMHSRGNLATMQKGIAFDDVVEEVRGELAVAVQGAIEAGISPSQIVIDPGLGFGKTYEQNLELLAGLDRLHSLDCPVLVGASRKSFLGQLTGEPADERLAGSLAAAAWAAARGADILRVHDVAETSRMLTVWNAIAEAV